MKEQGRRITLGILIALAVWALPHAARACSCLPPQPPKSAYDHSQAVFVGRVLGVAEEGGGDSLPLLRYEFEVQQRWKGELERLITLRTPADSAACGRRYKLGETYLIYAMDDRQGGLADHLCSRTRLLTAADEDLALLGPATAVTDPARPSPTAPSDREPPRIEPTPPADPPPTTGGRGCTIGDDPAGGLGLLLPVGLVFFLGLFRFTAASGLRRPATQRRPS